MRASPMTLSITSHGLPSASAPKTDTYSRSCQICRRDTGELLETEPSGLSNDRLRRISPVAPRPGEGPLTEPIPVVGPRPQERVVVPHFDHRSASSGWCRLTESGDIEAPDRDADQKMRASGSRSAAGNPLDEGTGEDVGRWIQAGRQRATPAANHLPGAAGAAAANPVATQHIEGLETAAGFARGRAAYQHYAGQSGQSFNRNRPR